MRCLTACLLAVTAVAAVAAVAVPAVADAAKPPLCEALPGQTLLQTPRLRVYRTVDVRKHDPDTSIQRVWACVPRHRVARGLVTLHNDLDATTNVVAAVAGGNDWVALQLETATGTDDSWALRVYGTTGRPAGGVANDGASPGPWVVTAAGALATIDDADGSLRVADAAGVRTVQASGASSLAVSGTTVYWTAAGLPRSAALGGHSLHVVPLGQPL